MRDAVGRRGWLRAGMVLCLGCCCFRLLAADAQVAAKSATRQALEEALRGVDTQMAQKAENMRKSYLATLKALRPKLQGAGDLDGILALDAEVKRVLAKDWQATPPAEEVPKSLQDLPARCAKALAAIDAERTAARVGVYERHVVALDQQVRALVRGGKLDQAKLLHEELTAAKGVLEELKRPSQPPAAEAPTADVPAVMAPFADDTEPAPRPDQGEASAKPPLLKLDFDGKDLPRYRKEGTGTLAERGGRLVVDNFGNNNQLQPYHGMRLRVPIMHRGDFRLKALATLHAQGGQAGLIRLTAHFANNSEAVCEVSEDYGGTLVSRFTGQADRSQRIYLRDGEARSHFSGSLCSTDIPLIIERKGNDLVMKAGDIEIGSGRLTTAATALCGVSIDMQRSRDKRRQPAEMWVETIELTP